MKMAHPAPPRQALGIMLPRDTEVHCYTPSFRIQNQYWVLLECLPVEPSRVHACLHADDVYRFRSHRASNSVVLYFNFVVDQSLSTRDDRVEKEYRLRLPNDSNG